MNYIWDIVIKAAEKGIPLQNISFCFEERFSPYMELNLSVLNSSGIDPVIPINPYYRFYGIFKNMFNVNNSYDKEIRNVLFDILVHFLAGVDSLQGMYKNAYYKRFVKADIESGVFGKNIQATFKLFSLQEKEVLIRNLLGLYKAGNELVLFKDTVREILKHTVIYANYETKDELLVFIKTKQNETNEAKLKWISDMFLPIQFHIVIYWTEHFGIIESHETMKIEQIAIY